MRCCLCFYIVFPAVFHINQSRDDHQLPPIATLPSTDTTARRLTTDTAVGWVIVNATAACERNDEGISRAGANSAISLDTCKQRCINRQTCVAIDYYTLSGYCNYFNTACSNPLKTANGASSYAIQVCSTFVDNAVVGCNASWETPGISGGEYACPLGFDICSSKERAAALGLTSSLCADTPSDGSIFVSMESSSDGLDCQTHGTNNLWGCGKDGNGVSFQTSSCGVFNRAISLQSSNTPHGSWIFSSNTDELNTVRKASGNGGVLCCKNTTHNVVVTGWLHDCAISQPDSSLACWGLNNHGQADVPSSLNTVSAVAVGWFHTCAISQSGNSLACWGSNSFGQTEAPSSLGSVSAVDTGGHHTCAIRQSDSSLACWGLNDVGQTDVPSSLGSVSAVATGWRHTCAISQSDSSLACWGSNTSGQTTVPSSPGSVLAVAAGQEHSCAISESDRSLVCWGLNDAGQTDVPSNLGRVSAVALGRSHTCAISQSDSALACWGLNLDGQTDIPSNLGTVSAVAARGHRTCAIGQSGSLLVCWGRNGEWPVATTAIATTTTTMACWDEDHEGYCLNGDCGAYPGRQSASDIWQCQQRCYDTAGCNYFAYRHSDGVCWLKTQKGSYVGGNLVQVGPRVCEAATTTAPMQDAKYTLFSTLVPWSSARTACSNRGMLLAVPKNMIDNAAIADLCFSVSQGSSSPDDACWIGGENPSGSILQWVDGTAGGFTNWNSGEPNLADEQCVIIRGSFQGSPGKWNDRSCNDNFAYVCEQAATTTTTTTSHPAGGLIQASTWSILHSGKFCANYISLLSGGSGVTALSCGVRAVANNGCNPDIVFLKNTAAFDRCYCATDDCVSTAIDTQYDVWERVQEATTTQGAYTGTTHGNATAHGTETTTDVGNTTTALADVATTQESELLMIILFTGLGILALTVSIIAAWYFYHHPPGNLGNGVEDISIPPPERSSRLRREQSEQLGISLKFVMEIFPGEAQCRAQRVLDVTLATQHQNTSMTSVRAVFGGAPESSWEPEWIKAVQELRRKSPNPTAVDLAKDMDFIDLSKVVAYGNHAFGFGHTCPRDSKPHSSIVDAVYDQGHSRPATLFLSWVWRYKLRVVLSSFDNYLKTHPDVKQDACYVWWCFFVNNQFRILGDQATQSFESLQSVFGGNLRRAGKMACMLDRVENSMYSQRLWCLFEVRVAKQERIELETVLPKEAVAEVDRLLQEGGLTRLAAAIVIDSESASASKPTDERAIKALIRTMDDSFQGMNSTVSRALVRSVKDVIGDALLNPNLEETVRNDRDGSFHRVVPGPRGQVPRTPGGRRVP